MPPNPPLSPRTALICGAFIILLALLAAAAPAAPDRLERDLEAAVAHVQPLLERYGYPVLFLAVLVEGVGLVAPGQTLLLAASLAAARGELNLALVWLVSFTAAVVGNSLGYLLGRRGGRPLLRRLRVNERHLERLEGYVSRKGPVIILLARFCDGLRQLNGIVAGLLEMPGREFSLYNILGAVLWTGVWGLGPYWFDREVVSLHLSFRAAAPYLAAVSLLGLLALLLYLLRRSKPTPA